MGYTNLSDTQLTGLIAAGANPSEFAVYALLTRFHELDRFPGHPSWCFRSQEDIADITGYHAKTVGKALRSLCKKEFLPEVTVLDRMEGGHKGQATVYDDKLWLYSRAMEGEPLVAAPTPKGEPQSLPNDALKGEPQSLPNDGQQRGAKAHSKGGQDAAKGSQIGPKGEPQSLPQNRYTEEMAEIRDSEMVKEEESKVVSLVSSEGDAATASARADLRDEWLINKVEMDPLNMTRDEWREWLARSKREGFHEFCRELDAIVAKEPMPPGDDEITAEEAGTILRAMARHYKHKGNRFTAYDAWLATAWMKIRPTTWVK